MNAPYTLTLTFSSDSPVLAPTLNALIAAARALQAPQTAQAAPTAAAPVEAPAAPAAAATATPPAASEKPKRTRRTAAQIAADELAAVTPEIPGAAPAATTEDPPMSQSALIALMKEVGATIGVDAVRSEFAKFKVARASDLTPEQRRAFGAALVAAKEMAT